MALQGGSKGQRRGSCGHIMAAFDLLEKCARCHEKKLAEDSCVLGEDCVIIRSRSYFAGIPAGDYNWHHVCVYIRESVCAFVTQFPQKLLQLHIFGKLLVLMNFLCPSIFLWVL